MIYRVLKITIHCCVAGKSSYLTGENPVVRGFIAISFTYKKYKEDWLLALAAILKEQGADYHSFTKLWERPLNRWRQETHIVNLAMMLKYEAVVCDLLGRTIPITHRICMTYWIGIMGRQGDVYRR